MKPSAAVRDTSEVKAGGSALSFDPVDYILQYIRSHNY